MRIDDLRWKARVGRKGIAATVIWEDNDHPKQDVFFELPERFSQGMTLSSHPFLVASVLPAMHEGEKRVKLGYDVCPVLHGRLTYVISMMQHWFYQHTREQVTIEAKHGSAVPKKDRGAGCMFSGGVDSLAMLRANRLCFSQTDPNCIKEAAIIFGQNIESDTSEKTWNASLRTLSEVTASVETTLIPVYTNIRSLNNDSKFFVRVNHGAILASVAHFLGYRFEAFSVASTNSIPSLILNNEKHFRPWGSHPLIDPHYSSAGLQIRHEDLTKSRLDKIHIISNWNEGLQNIRVCGPNWPGENCGRCEKCIRTMLGLLALEVLDKTEAFPLNDVTADQVKGVQLPKDTTDYWTKVAEYCELIPVFEAQGRHDLAEAIKYIIARSHRRRSKLISAVSRPINRAKSIRRPSDVVAFAMKTTDFLLKSPMP